MSKLEKIRLALLALLGIALVGVDLGIVYELADIRGQVFELLLLLQAELALVLAFVVFWPRRRWLRLIAGGFATAMVWLAVAKIAAENFLFRESLLTNLAVGLLMMFSFSWPCGTYFVLHRRVFGQRFSLFGRDFGGNPRGQFGLRHLLMLTASCAVVAFAARPDIPERLAGQFALVVNREDYTMLSLLCLFPGLAAGPVSVAVLRPSWRAFWIVPWLGLIGLGEMFFVELAVASNPTTITPDAVVQIALLVATGYVEAAIFLAGVFGLARLGGLKLAPQSDL